MGIPPLLEQRAAHLVDRCAGRLRMSLHGERSEWVHSYSLVPHDGSRCSETLGSSS